MSDVLKTGGSIGSLAKVSVELWGINNPRLSRCELAISNRSIMCRKLVVVFSLVLRVHLSSLFDCWDSTNVDMPGMGHAVCLCSSMRTAKADLALEGENVLEKIREGFKNGLALSTVVRKESVATEMPTTSRRGAVVEYMQPTLLLFESSDARFDSSDAWKSRAMGVACLAIGTAEVGVVSHHPNDVGWSASVGVPTESQGPREKDRPVKDDKTELPMSDNQSKDGSDWKIVEGESKGE